MTMYTAGEAGDCGYLTLHIDFHIPPNPQSPFYGTPLQSKRKNYTSAP